MANSSSIVRPHVPEEELHAYCDGELSASQRVEIAEHLLGCLICRSQHAEVEVLRTRTSTLLAMAMPRAIHGLDLKQLRPHRAPSRMPRFIAAAAIAAVSAGLWFTVRPDRVHEGAAKFASSTGTPSLTTKSSALDSQALIQRELVTASHVAVGVPTVTAAPVVAGAPAMRPTPIADVDPVIGTEWPQTDWNAAVKAGGTVSKVGGLAVASVRMHPSASGGRPTFMIRQTLADGRPVWVFEGPEDDVMPVNQILQASGIAMSMAARTHPDYVTSNGQVSRTRRMVTVVGHLTVDSLNVLAGKLNLQ